MKKVIRLTESDLHRLIEDTINELDWKTYQNAQMKRQQQLQNVGNPFAPGYDKQKAAKLQKSVNQLGDAAHNAYRNKYNGNNYYQNKNGEMGVITQDGNRHYRQNGDSNYWRKYNSLGYDPQTGVRYSSLENNPSKYDDVDQSNLPSLVDASRYRNGQSRYTPGKGWDVQESRNLINQITESVMNKLRY